MTHTRIRRPGDPGDVLELPGVLVQPDWLQDRLGHVALRTIDLRDADAYGSGHVPGAVHLELGALGTSRPGQDNVLLEPGPFAALMSRLGVSTGDAVVAYDDQWGLAAARLLWALHFHGHDRATVLDGGWDRWREEGRPVSDIADPPRPGDFSVSAHPERGATRAWLAENLADPGLVLLDTRTPGEFEQGHLPDALCWDWFNAVPPGSWNATRDPAELRAEWTALGVDSGREVVVYCRSGMRAAHTYMALRHAGYQRVRLYDGSWQEWSTAHEEADVG